MIPPPTPVPSVTITMLLKPFPPPCHISPSAAIFASLPTLTGSPIILDNSSAALKIPHPRFTQRRTVPSALTGPGTPIPIPFTSLLSICFSASLSSMDAAISPKIYFPPSSVRVVISHLSTIVPSAVKSPILTVVPPISTPNTYFAIFLYILLISLRHYVNFSLYSVLHGYTIPEPHCIPSSSVCG